MQLDTIWRCTAVTTNLLTGKEEAPASGPTVVLYRGSGSSDDPVTVVSSKTIVPQDLSGGAYAFRVLIESADGFATGDLAIMVIRWTDSGAGMAKVMTVAEVIGTPMRGTDGANTTAPDNTQGAAVITALGDVLGAPIDTNLATDISHIQLAVENLDFATPTNVTDAQTAIISQVDANETKIDTLTANLATVDTVVDGIQADLSNETDGLTALKAAVDAIFTTAIAESYAASGAAGTPAQILYMIQQAITEFAISGTTKTIKKLNGSTTAATETLDDATNPTSITRAT